MLKFSIYATVWFVMPPRRKSVSQYLQEKTLRVDEDIKKKIQEVEGRLRDAEDAVDAGPERITKLYVVWNKFLDEIVEKMKTTQEMSKKAINSRERDDLMKLVLAYVELGNKLQEKKKEFHPSVLEKAEAKKNANRVETRPEIQLREYMQATQINENNAEKQKKLTEMQENVRFCQAKVRDFVQKASKASSPKERNWFVTLSDAYEAEARRTKEEVKELESGETVMVWDADRQDVKMWIEEYWSRCVKASTKDEKMGDLVWERAALMGAKRELVAAPTSSAERTLEINERMKSITEKVNKLDEQIEDFGDTVAAGGDGNKVIVTAPGIIERKARAVLERFKLLLITRKEHRDGSDIDWNDFEDVSANLRRSMRVHLKDVELHYDRQEVARDAGVSKPSRPLQQAAEGSARRAEERAAAAKTHFSEIRSVRFPESDTAAAWNGQIDWFVSEMRVVVDDNGNRREGVESRHRIQVSKGQSLFAEINAKVPFYDWSRVRSQSYVLNGYVRKSQELDWSKSYGSPTDEMDCKEVIDKFGHRITANPNATDCHLLLYRSSKGF